MGKRARDGQPVAKTAKKAAPKAKTGGRLGGCLARLTGLGCVGSLGVGGGGLLVALIAVLALIGAYQYFIVAYPGPEFDAKNVQGIIRQESPVYYRDGVTRVGVFFEDEHRDYLAWEQLPPAYVFAIVAAEDERFWTHGGVDPWGLMRAIGQNVVSGDLVSGGSTLTQQTAKNLFYRPDRSIKSKGTELVNALKLESHFSKSDILTFYANQFHVSGNGRGLGIAARYFFDKDASELTTLECAFLAGLVKGPTNYDPFLQKTDEKRERAIERAHDRTKYVLRRLSEVDGATLSGPLPLTEVDRVKAEAADLLAKDFQLPFKEGTFRYDSNAVLDEVAHRLAEPPFAQVLTDAGITDPATAGLEVVTTLDETVQRESIYGLWHHLTEVGTMLEAHTADDFTRKDVKVSLDPTRPTLPHEFRLASVGEISGAAGKKFLTLDLGGTPCIADRDAIARAALMVYRGERKDKNAKVSNTYIDSFAARFSVGSVVWVSVRTVPADGTPVCDLELRPELQGSSMVLQDGQVLAMVGGNDNRNFNRAIAPRQFGSTWKPLLYHSAIELGWSPADELDNRPNVFPFQGTYYYPSSDHEPAPAVSLSWAGVNSENIASVWLLFHVTDKLTETQVSDLAKQFEMVPGDQESATDYQKRLTGLGVQVSKGRLDEGAFLEARTDVLSTLSRSTHPEDALGVRSMVYGLGFTSERAKIQSAGGADRGWKTAALDRSWTGLQPKAQLCVEQYRQFREKLATGDVVNPGQLPLLSVKPDGEKLLVACGEKPPEGYEKPIDSLVSDFAGKRRRATEPEAEPEASPAPTTAPEADPAPSRRRPGRKPTNKPTVTPTRPAKPAATQGSWSIDVPTYDAGPIAAEEDVWIEQSVHLGTLTALDTAFQAHRGQRTDPWAPEALVWNQDYRVLVGIRYVVAMARQYGVDSDLREGLPLTLGASEITLEEATSVYGGITTGLRWDFPGVTASGQTVDSPPAPTLLIAEIRDVDGNVLYKATPKSAVVAQPATGAMTMDILRNVVEYGTGKRALDTIVLDKKRVPLGGKTGTTNEYKNAAFLGYIPRANGSEFTVADGYSVGVYVGYDDNRPMDVGNIKLAGANGALPAWMVAARSLAEANLLGTPTGKPSGATWPLEVPKGLVRVSAASSTGLAGAETSGGGASILTWPRVDVVAAPNEIPHLPENRRPGRQRPAARTPDAAPTRRGLWGR